MINKRHATGSISIDCKLQISTKVNSLLNLVRDQTSCAQGRTTEHENRVDPAEADLPVLQAFVL
jgi:hypothetical protein